MVAVFGVPICVVVYVSKHNDDIKINLLSPYAIPFWALVVFVILHMFVRHLADKHQADNVKIVVKCGVVYGYHPKIRPIPHAHRRARSSEPTNAITLTVDGKNRMYRLPLDFKRPPIGSDVCLKIQDGSNTKGAYPTFVISQVDEKPINSP